VNLIGEPTDYNDGFVMPIALDRHTWVAGAPRTDRLIVAHSREYGATATIDLDAPAAGPTGQWVDYVRGIAVVLDGGLERAAPHGYWTDASMGRRDGVLSIEMPPRSARLLKEVS
jgi:galactokinase